VAISPSSSVQRARQELAARLKEIRLDAGLTARALSARAGWHEAKTSRIESAKQPLTDADIRAWCRACDADGHAADLIAASRAADSMYTEWRRLQRTGLRRLQESYQPLFDRTRLFRVYCSNVIPGFLQTPGYATALLSAIAVFSGTPDDTHDAAEARMARNRILRAPGRRFALVVEESVLRYQIGDPATMAGQLGHLLDAMSLPSLTLGIIPLTAARRPMWTLEGFTVFDDARVHVELLTAQVTVTAPTEIALYLHAYGKLAEMALYGPAARTLITAAITAVT
jgi:transcriptional regulator with XRE-family HTH domain